MFRKIFGKKCMVESGCHSRARAQQPTPPATCPGTMSSWIVLAIVGVLASLKLGETASVPSCAAMSKCMDVTVEPVTQADGACPNCHYKVCFKLNLYKSECAKQASKISHTCAPHDMSTPTCYPTSPNWQKWEDSNPNSGNAHDAEHCYYAPPNVAVQFITKDGNNNAEPESTWQIDGVDVMCKTNDQPVCGGGGVVSEQLLWTVTTPQLPPNCGGTLPLPKPASPSPSPGVCTVAGNGPSPVFP